MLNIFINPITQSFISITGLLLSHNMVLIIYLSTIHYMLYTLCIWSPYTGWRQAFLVIYRLIYTFELATLDLNNLYVSRYTLYSTQSTHGDIRAYWLRPGEIMRDIRQPVWSGGPEWGSYGDVAADIQRQNLSGWSDLPSKSYGYFNLILHWRQKVFHFLFFVPS